MFSQIKFYAELSNMINRIIKDRKTTRAERERLDYELSIIKQTDTAFAYLFAHNALQGFSDEEYCFWGRENNCFVNYLLGLTNINPVRYDLSFELFFNHTRHSRPIFRFYIKNGTKTRFFSNICNCCGITDFIRGHDVADAYFFDMRDVFISRDDREKSGTKTFREVLSNKSAGELFCKGLFEFDISKFCENEVIEREFGNEEIYNKAVSLSESLISVKEFNGITDIEKILAPTCGRVIFQQQIIKILHSCGGFDFALADNIRRAVCRKKSKFDDTLKTVLRNKYGQGGEEFVGYLLTYAEHTISKGCVLAQLSNNVREKSYN